MPPPSSAGKAPPSEIVRLIAERFPPGASVVRLKGDASTRRFYRVSPSSGPSQILMLYPGSLSGEEIALRENHDHLKAIGVPLPAILSIVSEAGAIFVEDLGDVSLQHLLVENPARDRIPLYREAIDIIVLLQERGTRELSPDAPARKHALDETRFRFELDHFFRHFVTGFRSMRPAPEEEDHFRGFFGWLAVSLNRAERVLCHRDFQSRNLMVTPWGLRVIDYQDAMMGPVSYDLAALLRDSSLDLDDRLRDEGIRYFLGRRPEIGPEEFREEFERMALQRNIKDLGTFGYQVHARGNEGYRQYIPRTIRMVREAMIRHQRYHDVFPLFEKYVFSGVDG